ncbi:type II RES/Xre toxin-antitoxin system antitoxin [Endothiovibrio diazotrophicus]
MITTALSEPPPPPLTADQLLGGQGASPHSTLEWVPVIRDGLAITAVDAIKRSVGLTQAELATALAIPERTLARRKREGRLNSEESAKLVRLARVVERAEEVFETLEGALDWLKSPNTALAGVPPLSLMDTDVGAEGVLDTLGRIEHGVFA